MEGRPPCRPTPAAKPPPSKKSALTEHRPPKPQPARQRPRSRGPRPPSGASGRAPAPAPKNPPASGRKIFPHFDPRGRVSKRPRRARSPRPKPARQRHSKNEGRDGAPPPSDSRGAAAPIPKNRRRWSIALQKQNRHSSPPKKTPLAYQCPIFQNTIGISQLKSEKTNGIFPS
jgi:hypothetical protein